MSDRRSPATTARSVGTGLVPRAFRLLRASWLDVPVWFWLAAIVAAALLIGPGFGPGAWLNLDLVVISDPPMPSGAWGMGPGLPRRIPMWIPLTWLSNLTDGLLVGRAFVMTSVAAAAAGAFRLVRIGGLTGLTAGVLYGLGPFLTTRIGVGHWQVVLVMALLPWAVGDLLRPHRSVRRVLWWSVALGMGGVYGGVVAGTYLVAGLVVDRTDTGLRRRLWPVAAFGVGQLTWLAPLGVVAAAGTGRALSDSASFSPPLSGPLDLARIVAGLGFWNPPFQVGRGAPALTALIGAGLLALGVVGTPRLPALLRRPMVAVAAVSLLVAVASALPGTERAFSWFTGTPLGSPLRESQRYLAPFLLWVAAAAALGARELAERLWARSRAREWLGSLGGLVAVLPLVGGVLLAAPALWGISGQLDPAEFPPEWAEAEAVVEAEPGTVVAFPWFQYFTLDIADDRAVLDVVPFAFGGDVLASTDPGLGDRPMQESSDPREPDAATIAAAARRGEPVADRLAALGVRWVVLQHEINWEAYTGVLRDPELEVVVEGGSLTLFRVVPWAGSVVQDDGEVVDATSPVRPVLDVAASSPATWAAPFQRGWLRGTEPAGMAPGGLVSLPGGSGPLWYWPSLVVLSADLVVVVVVAASLVRIGRPPPRERRRRGPRGAQPTEATS